MDSSAQADIRFAYSSKNYMKCVELIDELPEILKESSRYKILKASCFTNIVGMSKYAHSILDELETNSSVKNPPIHLFIMERVSFASTTESSRKVLNISKGQSKSDPARK